jgi:cytochrome c oxidase subunit 3
LLVAAITILFAAFTSTYLVRRGEADWQTGPLPSILWVNTAVLLASSATMEWARSRGRGGKLDGLRTWLTVTTGLGVAFLFGQIQAWRQLVAAGIYVSTNPHSAFFYLLSGAHGLHIVGGVLGLFYVLMKVRRVTAAAEAMDSVDAAATYWHFLDGLWLYLFIVLFGI